MKTSTKSIKPERARCGRRPTRTAHRALKQDEVTVIDQLLEDVLASDNLARAWKRVKANKGAPGIDGMTIEDFPGHARAHWPAVRGQIREGRYQPQAVRRVEIPKPDGGKRMLGIATVMDRVIQQACRSSAHADIGPDILGIEFRLLAGLQCTSDDSPGALLCQRRLRRSGGYRPGQVFRHAQP